MIQLSVEGAKPKLDICGRLVAHLLGAIIEDPCQYILGSSTHKNPKCFTCGSCDFGTPLPSNLKESVLMQ